MSKPPLNPDKTLAGIALDPQTLERVVPESRRPDGSIRKQRKIRPGFTPQEDIRRFRGTKQAQMDANTLPKGHVIGWVPPSSTTSTTASGKPMSKSAKKNAKRKEKRAEKQPDATVPDNWDDDDETPDGTVEAKSSPVVGDNKSTPTKQQPTADTNGLADQLKKLSV
ncbi:hypothetical protein AMATHDRAFT_74995 [Amanita thiersii Skay4041]|uniref:WIBG Mago-binding domain-containing protein n=1 Tax=Amanita thiersii Skay4041 TaxID=703135 RepID=A0A2A9NT27_9AGAR|nr:hypothetical protein AMATHDRAFT_74995 [Amanita thiersii Skay4041]